MSIKDYNLPMLNLRNDWTDWINSIEDLAVRNDVWNYCDPEGIENLVFTVTKPPDSASKDTIQKYHSLQAIYDSERKKYDKVSERIDITAVIGMVWSKGQTKTRPPRPPRMRLKL
ncbi:hypothetical protein BKA66DRAFT_455270 [Pyrenochaeta sp. MPI-SDFR-AT-0127]|nr:hypothetical protein BKA66DRAFT_455270 [Pyrenochaeta sp. MPI-SDFR-AT-0127]